MPNSFKVSTLYIPTVPDNEEAFQVFENAEREYIFFVGSKEKEYDSSIRSQKEVPFQEKILSLKNNHFP